ncbi:MAG: hypothetical protein M1832_000824 [Thelocarpon impressellum]|nr:MAG: hypothetical protein M1832_000824 [Thelocarpon impressellum]
MSSTLPRKLLSAPRRCQSCAITLIRPRAFSTTPTALKIGPESPQFIEVPQPPQQRYPVKRTIKGVLPVPRNLFPRRRLDKPSPEYLAAATPERSTRDASGSPNSDSRQAEHIEWKRRLAATRRQNLRESLVELRKRKRRTDNLMIARSARSEAERHKLVYQEEGEDERLTSPTITESMKKLQLGTLSDPDREARVAEKAANVRARQAEDEAHRRDTLHTLYMHARDFITTEAQLSEEIERAFTPQHPDWAKDRQGQNIWNTGPPETVQEMLNRGNVTDAKAVRRHEGYARVTHERVNRIAEELTGGKM